MIKLKEILKNEWNPLSQKDRMDKYDIQKRKSLDIPYELILNSHSGYFGTILGMRIYTVNGEYIRDYVDQDFVAGGNPGRYTYIPANEIWIEDNLDLIDTLAIILHEIVECSYMVKDGMSYNNAHDIANKKEKTFRKLIIKNQFDIQNKGIPEHLYYIEKFITKGNLEL